MLCATIILIGILLASVVLAILGSNDFTGRSYQALALVSMLAFLLIGPYSYLAGAISLDFGGKRGGATASSIIDGVGYLFGGIIAGKVVADLSVSLGWQGVFKLLTIVALLTSVAAACFLVDQLRLDRSPHAVLATYPGDSEPRGKGDITGHADR